MQTKTRASAVKIYLFFLFISLFAVSGCGLDIDFGSGDDKDTEVRPNETIMGTIEDAPSMYDGSFVVKASVVRDGNIEECCKITASEGSEFSLEGNLDPEVQLQIFDSSEASLIGTERIDVFPGATIDIGDITIEDNGSIDYDQDDVDITFNGEVSNNENCIDENGELTGNINVTISSEGSETELILVKLDGTRILREDDPMCHQIAPGREIEVDGKLKANKTVEATIIEIE